MAATDISQRDEDQGGSRDAAPKNPFAALVLFIRQVIAELAKVVTPTRRELLTYFSVVLIFVVFVMLFISGIDYGVNKIVAWAFTDSGE